MNKSEAMNKSVAMERARSTSRHRNQPLGVFLLLGALMVMDGKAQLVPVGEETLVNDPAVPSASSPAVAVDDLGRFLVVWGANVDGGDFGEIVARRFDPNGSPVGEEFVVNSHTTDSQGTPVVGRRTDGGFVVAWSSFGSAGTDTDSLSIQARHLAVDGTPQGMDFQVNTTTTDAQSGPSLAMHPDGSFLIVWQSRSSGGDDSDGRSIQGQLFDAQGDPKGAEFQVNSYTTSEQQQSRAAALGDGFVVTWYNSAGSPGNDDDEESIQARFLDSNGPVGSDFQVNTYTTNEQSQPFPVTGPGDQFAVVWAGAGPGTDTIFASIQAQRFETDGTPLGGQFQVNTYTPGSQETPSGVFTTAEQMLVVWNSGGAFTDGLDGDRGGVSLQTFDRDGNPLGEELLVNTYTTSNQLNQRVAINRQGDAVVVWVSLPDSPNNEILFQRFADPAVKLFEDGFESGDTTVWSTAEGATASESTGGGEN